jgi:hypothetical protein
VIVPISQQLKLKSLPDRWAFRFLWGSLLVYLVCYSGSILSAAKLTPLWMDEILVAWTSRLSSASRIYTALMQGADFSPPAQHLFLHYFSLVAGGSNFALRVPSMAAVLLAALFTFALNRRHLGDAGAAFGTCFVLESLRVWGLQVRPYALVTVVSRSHCCFGMAGTGAASAASW